MTTFFSHLRPTYSKAALFSVAALVGTLALTSCSPSDPSAGAASQPSSASSLEKVTVGLLPITDVAPVYLGIQEGFFKEEGLELEVQLAQGGAAIVPAIVSGQYQFGYSNVVSLLVANQNEIPIQVTSNGSSSTNVPTKDTTEVAALANSDISSVADLAGKTVAINALNNFGEIAIRNSMEKAGVDPSTVKFTEIPYPNMPAQLASGAVDVAWTTEPFRTQILQEGGKIVASPMPDMAENFDAAYFFTSKQTAQTNPQLVTRFNAALKKSFAYASANHDAVRKIVQEYAKLSPQLAANVVLPQWRLEVNESGLKTLAKRAVKYGVLRAEPDYDGFLAK